jgi:crotonobetainyl-CoA:carnitine CoA-transferase CaiB-like acyl-CoA transferase
MKLQAAERRCSPEDLTRALAGPHAGMMFGDLGARVIKVERPGGDDTRSWAPPFVGDDDISTYYLLP